MNSLKPISASLLCLGLISGSVLAAGYDTKTQLDSMKSNTAKMESSLSQNQAGGGSMPDWFNSISVGGQANFDGSMSNRTPTAMGLKGSPLNVAPGTTSDIAVSNASLFVDAKVNEWVNTHVGLLYGRNSRSFARVSANAIPIFMNASYLDEAYATIGNLSRSPFYLRAGRQYLPFGDYSRYAMTNMVQSTTQLLSMTQADAAQVGFVDSSGFNGSAYVFRGTQLLGTAGDSTKVQNFGLNLGYTISSDTMGYKVGVGYLRNMVDVKYINSTTRVASPAVVASPDASVIASSSGYTTKVGGMSVDASANSGPFDASVHYVTALQNFSAADVAYYENGVIKGAKPAAWGLDLGYGFQTMGHVSRFGVGYQGSREANLVGTTTGSTTLFALGLPKNRYLANYVVNLSKCTDLGFEVYNDRAYSASKGGTGSNATTGVVRLGVKFS